MEFWKINDIIIENLKFVLNIKEEIKRVIIEKIWDWFVNNDYTIEELNQKFLKLEISVDLKLNANNIKFEDDETKIEYQKYLDEVNEYNRKIANGETPDKDLSTITDEFKQKFVIEEKNNFETNNYMLNELIEKLD